MTDDLITWLRSQLDEDERVAMIAADFPYHDAADAPWHRARRLWKMGAEFSSDPLIATWGNPKQVLADIEAKRRILDVYEEAKRYYEGPGRAAPAGEVHGLWTAIRHLATAYADRPGYREEWRP